MHYIHYLQLLLAATVAAKPVLPRGVQALNAAAFEQAHQRDGSATRALSNVQIKSESGKCLFVDKLSGDFRANLTPLQLADCGSTDGQGWDVITSGKHNNQPGKALIVNTLTQACLSVDPRRPAGSQVHMFSCGGRADGGGEVTNSQLFPYGGDGKIEMDLAPDNSPGKCLFISDGLVDITICDKSNGQKFTFGDNNGNEGGNNNGNNGKGGKEVKTTVVKPSQTNSDCSKPSTVLVTNTVIVTMSPTEEITGSTSYMTITESAFPGTTTAADSDTTVTESSAETTEAPSSTVSNDKETPVSRGGNLDPSAAAEANAFDDTAKRAVESINIRSSDGRCLSIDQLAGDFRENLIPVSMVKCSEDASQKFDVITSGKHNDGKQGGALLVSVVTNGCLSFDGRRDQGDTVTMFSCGGRADGEGGTDGSQLYPFDRTDNIVLEPANGNKKVCLVAGKDRLESGDCDNQKDQVFELVRVL